MFKVEWVICYCLEGEQDWFCLVYSDFSVIIGILKLLLVKILIYCKG